MSGGVLAVMDRVIESAEKFVSALPGDARAALYAQDCRQARDAVAEYERVLSIIALGPRGACGCKPVCQCLSQPSLELWAEYAETLADEALSRANGGGHVE